VAPSSCHGALSSQEPTPSRGRVCSGVSRLGRPLRPGAASPAGAGGSAGSEPRGAARRGPGRRPRRRDH
jgi:hypothetical protein